MPTIPPIYTAKRRLIEKAKNVSYNIACQEGKVKDRRQMEEESVWGYKVQAELTEKAVDEYKEAFNSFFSKLAADVKKNPKIFSKGN